MDVQEFATSVLYRIAYGIAADRVEASRFGTLDGRRPQAQGGAAEGIEAEVLARFGASDPTARGMIREAIDDALAGRRPRW
ncbi:MAG TPA: hypothetical protein VKP69_34515 [Isosphaeraceae bacterium]|nr:hypothetical protein [Isosphaeraceae bacterium]